MKKISVLTLLLLSAMTTIGANVDVQNRIKVSSVGSPKKVTATNTEIISTTPEGDLIDPLYGASGKTYLIYQGMLGNMTDNNGYVSAMVRTDDAVYIRNMVSQYDAPDYWVKGDVQTDGTVIFRFPQLVYQEEGSTVNRDLYIAQLTPTQNDKTVSLSIDESNCDLHMKWEGNRLVQIMPESETLQDVQGIVGLTNSDGAFIGFGEQELAYKLIDDVLLTPPADMVPEQYIIAYTNGMDQQVKGLIKLGYDGSDVWFQGFNTFIPEAWVKGIIDGNTISIPCTYTGTYENYLTYITGLSSDNEQLVAPLTITKNDADYTVNGKMFISIGNEVVDYNDYRVFSDVAMIPYVEGSKTPSTPVIEPGPDGSVAWSEEEGMGALIFTLDAVDTDGIPLDPDKLYYQVFRNGEPYTFLADAYGLEQDMDEIPYNFQSDLIMNYAGYFFVFFLEDMDYIGVRSIYKDGENETYSQTATYYFKDSVDGIESDGEVVAEEYFDLTGRKIDNPQIGLYIKMVRYADGSVRATKVLK